VDIATGSLLSLIYRVVGIASLAALTILTARVLPASDFGVYSSAIVAIGAVGTIAASFSGSAGYYVSNQARPAAEVASNTALLSLGIGGALLIIALAVALFTTGDTRTAALLGGFAIPPIVARTALGGVYVGVNALLRYAFSLYGYGFFALALTLAWVVALDHRTATGGLIAWIGAQYLAFAAVALLSWRWWGWFAAHRPDTRLAWGLVTFGAFTGLAGFISYFNYRVDQLLVIWLDSQEGAGLYAAAVRVAEGLWLFSTAIAVASYAAVGATTRSESSRITAEGVRHTLLIVVALAIPIALLAPWLLGLAYGAEFKEASWALRLLAAATLIYAPQSILSNYYTVQLGKPWISLALAGTSLAVSVAASLLIIPRVGFIGGAWATLISYGVTAVLSTLLFLRMSDASARDLFLIRRSDLESYPRLARRILGRLGLGGGAATTGQQA
jgi:O-antigen/teichoic acid export membrane protein